MELGRQLSKHVWMIYGKNKSRFPSGNALFIKTPTQNIIFDTNPGEKRIDQFLQETFSLHTEDLTDLYLSHPHLDHIQGISQIYEKVDVKLHGHEDSLMRCEKKALIGLLTGMQKDNIHAFEEFGRSLGHEDRTYPESKKHKLMGKDIINLEGNNKTTIEIKCHETQVHCPHMLNFEINDGDISLYFATDYDFTPVPWYGLPFRGSSIELFKKEVYKIIEKKNTMIISSHLIEPIPLKNQLEEADKYAQIIDNKTIKAVDMLPNSGTISLDEIGDFYYPVQKMIRKKKYPDSYIIMAQNWDYWILLTHLEDAWSKGLGICTDADNDAFLEECIRTKKYISYSENPEIVDKFLLKGWVESPQQVLESNIDMPYTLPYKCRWEKK